jgi:opacity protein-like surface antigen
MAWLRMSVTAAAALAMTGALARAADMPGYPSSPPPDYRSALLDFNTGWYLRGDIGGRWGQLTGVQSVAPNPNPTDSSLGQGMIGSLGVGIKSNWLRTDVTVDYASPLNYQGTLASAGDTTAKIQATTALFNGYLDLGTWYRVSPYIGAGAGVAYVHVFDYATTASFSGDTSRTQWNFAYAGMAGIAFAVSNNLMMDVGYRYLNFGDVNTGAMTFRNVAAHEVQVGLRWSFDDLHYPN